MAFSEIKYTYDALTYTVKNVINPLVLVAIYLSAIDSIFHSVKLNVEPTKSMDVIILNK